MLVQVLARANSVRLVPGVVMTSCCLPRLILYTYPVAGLSIGPRDSSLGTLSAGAVTAVNCGPSVARVSVADRDVPRRIARSLHGPVTCQESPRSRVACASNYHDHHSSGDMMPGKVEVHKDRAGKFRSGER